jgi:hypothetical protein
MMTRSGNGAAQLEIAQVLAGELIAQEAEGCFVIECWWSFRATSALTP